MWHLLSDPHLAGHPGLAACNLESFARVLSVLASRPYANKVYGYWSVFSFIIGTAPSYEASFSKAYRKILLVEPFMRPISDRFRVGYGKTPSSDWGAKLVDGQRSGCWEACSEEEVAPLVDRIVTRDLDGFVSPLTPVTFRPAWRTSEVIALCEFMYGSQDFSAMPVLADALQEAGCDSEEVLGHCLGEGPHVRECWVLSLVLGKE